MFKMNDLVYNLREDTCGRFVSYLDNNKLNVVVDCVGWCKSIYENSDMHISDKSIVDAEYLRIFNIEELTRLDCDLAMELYDENIKRAKEYESKKQEEVIESQTSELISELHKDIIDLSKMLGEENIIKIVGEKNIKNIEYIASIYSLLSVNAAMATQYNKICASPEYYIRKKEKMIKYIESYTKIS